MTEKLLMTKYKHFDREVAIDERNIRNVARQPVKTYPLKQASHAFEQKSVLDKRA